MPAASFDQSTYQVRLEWGTAGLARLAPADIVVIVDVLRFSSRIVKALEGEVEYPLDDAARELSPTGVEIALLAAEQTSSIILLGALTNASAVADAVLAAQARRRARTSVAIIAAGDRGSSRLDGDTRFAVEDFLGAGAIIDALAAGGIDHTSPEAAAAGESFAALRRALRHLLAASGSGRELLAHGATAEVVDAAALNTSTIVPVLTNGVFRAL